LASLCPARYEKDKLVITDRKEAEHLRTSLVDGVFGPWFELGRAPTPAEVGERLKLDEKQTELLLDKLASCGAIGPFGIHRVPESELIAVAWPLANVPTGIDVTVEGKKPVHARCAIDALGISKMLGKKATVDATTNDRLPLHVEVDGDKLVSGSPSEAVVFKGGSCDQMMFFSNMAALERWRHGGAPPGRTLTLAEAVTRGAETFGRMTRPLPGT
jgi:hypothetical protein